ncbi:hypothetical protein LIER_06141 [Lithospermum erythrorhizon]|uniref:Uncharacterized protein n=1 Tax=Lithospermum erythrorhizon TaxID=34254 RepID=A0AAV3P7Z5_LITER
MTHSPRQKTHNNRLQMPLSPNLEQPSRREIEKLIQRGYLKEFTRGRGHEERPQGRGNSPPRYPPQGRKLSPAGHDPYRRPKSPYLPRTDKRVEEEREENSLVTGHIATIVAGIYGGGDSRISRKKYAPREVYAIVNTQCNTNVITFTYPDCQGLEMPHDDALVIAPKIAHFTIERMLVDTGSSVDILYLSTFDKLHMPRSIIRANAHSADRVHRPLHVPSRSGNILRDNGHRVDEYNL